MLKINRETYKDKVYGCWMGKNAGGTLGEPLEKMFGQEEMFDVSWYPELPEEGLPNDDLEIQLIWLQALEEKGPDLKARDLAEYWLDSIVYNFDEYGLHKHNLKKGLMPPVSGWYNNWFKDCMGSPIRSEIWACVAPGAPEIAARYAYEDAVCDHAGGESVYGEIFNAVVESAAFVIEDKIKLIKIGLNSIPDTSLTYKSIEKALNLFNKGTDWKKARNILKEEFYSPIAQYSPLNLGFQTIGLLYGEDFGDAICKAVNCGWDTDCTGATVGAILGIIEGRSNLPEKWTEPLGDEVATNVRTGGIRNLDAPTDLQELTAAVSKMGEKVLKYWDTDVVLSSSSGEEKEKVDLEISEATASKNKNPHILNFDLKTVKASLIYKDKPAAVGDNTTSLSLEIENTRACDLKGTVEVILPPSWELNSSLPPSIDINQGETERIDLELKTPGNSIEAGNQGTIIIDIEKRPDLLRIPLALAGGFRWLVSPVFSGKSLEDDCEVKENIIYDNPPSSWKEVWRREYDLKPEEIFGDENGVVYLLHHLKSKKKQDTILGVPTDSRMKLWLNGKIIHKTEEKINFRPNGIGDGSNYVETTLAKGWNQILIKLEKAEAPVRAHFVSTRPDAEHPINNGATLMGVNHSLFSWNE